MKDKTKRFAPSFAVDLKHAVDYYDCVSVNTGNRFRQEIQAKLDLAACNSEGFSVIYNDIRPIRLRSFPYILLYRSFENHVEFAGLVHGSTERLHWFEQEH